MTNLPKDSKVSVGLMISTFLILLLGGCEARYKDLTATIEAYSASMAKANSEVGSLQTAEDVAKYLTTTKLEVAKNQARVLALIEKYNKAEGGKGDVTKAGDVLAASLKMQEVAKTYATTIQTEMQIQGGLCGSPRADGKEEKDVQKALANGQVIMAAVGKSMEEMTAFKNGELKEISQ